MLRSFLVASAVTVILIMCCECVAGKKRIIKVNVEVNLEEYDENDKGTKKNTTVSIENNVFGDGETDNNNSENSDDDTAENTNGDMNDDTEENTTKGNADDTQESISGDSDKDTEVNVSGDSDDDTEVNVSEENDNNTQGNSLTTPGPSLSQNFTKDIHFLLWTRVNEANTDFKELMIDDALNLKSSTFRVEKPTVLIIHGWNSSGRADWILRAKSEYLRYQDCNFIVVDWKEIASNLNYFEVALDSPKVAIHTARFLDYLHNGSGLNISEVYVIGHSLGAHMAGIMGLHLENGPLGRITGLDPAGPGFYEAPLEYRLDKSDANFVDIILTNAGLIIAFCVGLDGSYGHANFFPNGGQYQPGCFNLATFTNLLSVGCSHYRSYEYWIESINGNTTFKSVPCPDRSSYNKGNCVDCGSGCQDMGVHANTELRGNFFLKTNAAPPFAKG